MLGDITAADELYIVTGLSSFKPLIDEWLQADKLAPRKQRHTAKRVYKRLKDEADGFDCSYRLVALYVKQKKEELRLPLLPPLENKALLPQQKVIPFRNDLKMLDAALKKGGASNG